MGSSIAFSQTKEELKELAKQQAEVTATATIALDFKTVLMHTHPGVTKLMGGEETAVQMMENTFKAMGEQGFVFEKAEVISVSDVVFEQDEYRCYVQNKNQMRMNDTRIFSDSYLLGIYDNEKKIWYFLEAKQLQNTGLTDQILPGFETSLNIPEDNIVTEEIKD